MLAHILTKLRTCAHTSTEVNAIAPGVIWVTFQIEPYCGLPLAFLLSLSSPKRIARRNCRYKSQWVLGVLDANGRLTFARCSPRKHSAWALSMTPLGYRMGGNGLT